MFQLMDQQAGSLWYFCLAESVSFPNGVRPSISLGFGSRILTMTVRNVWASDWILYMTVYDHITNDLERQENMYFSPYLQCLHPYQEVWISNIICDSDQQKMTDRVTKWPSPKHVGLPAVLQMPFPPVYMLEEGMWDITWRNMPLWMTKTLPTLHSEWELTGASQSQQEQPNGARGGRLNWGRFDGEFGSSRRWISEWAWQVNVLCTVFPLSETPHKTTCVCIIQRILIFTYYFLVFFTHIYVYIFPTYINLYRIIFYSYARWIETPSHVSWLLLLHKHAQSVFNMCQNPSLCEDAVGDVVWRLCGDILVWCCENVLSHYETSKPTVRGLWGQREKVIRPSVQVRRLRGHAQNVVIYLWPWLLGLLGLRLQPQQSSVISRTSHSVLSPYLWRTHCRPFCMPALLPWQLALPTHHADGSV